MGQDNLLDFCRFLNMDGEAAKTCCAYAYAPGELQRAYRLLYGRPELFFHATEKAPNAPQRYLALYAQFAQMLRPVYEQWGVSEAVYRDTFFDIVLWERRYFGEMGVHGLAEARWLACHVRMELFRLGSLQFEPMKALPETVEKSAGVLPQELVLNVHIPQGADLSAAAVRDSYRRALDFWGCDSAVLVCNSWLLAPELSSLLPAKSKILSFASDFSIAAVNRESPQAQERIFGSVKNDPREYPVEGSTLQRAARQHLLQGGTLPRVWGWQRVNKLIFEMPHARKNGGKAGKTP